MEGLDLESYFKGSFDKVDLLTIDNAIELINRVTRLLDDIGYMKPITINSGYRSPEHNEAIGGKPKSYHMQGKAIDIGDRWHEIYKLIAADPDVLIHNDLWMEDGLSTPTWVHLDMGTRLYRKVRIFKP